MATARSLVPRSNFAMSSRQIQQLRHASSATSNTASQLSLFRAPASVIKPWKAIAGAQEWQTSTYHYNKQTMQTLPTAQNTADTLLQHYSTMIKSRGTPSSASSSTARNAIAARRKTAEKMYVSGTQVKDFGDRIVVKAFVFDGVEAAKEEKNKRDSARKAGGEKAAGTGGRRRGPVRTGAGSGAGAQMGVGEGALAAGRLNRSPGVQRAQGAGR